MDLLALPLGIWMITLSLVRLSRSTVETLLSQFKSTARGKLSAMNYPTARAAHLVKHTVTPHHSSKGYRDAPLNLMRFH